MIFPKRSISQLDLWPETVRIVDDSRTTTSPTLCDGIPPYTYAGIVTSNKRGTQRTGNNALCHTELRCWLCTVGETNELKVVHNAPQTRVRVGHKKKRLYTPYRVGGPADEKRRKEFDHSPQSVSRAPPTLLFGCYALQTE